MVEPLLLQSTLYSTKKTNSLQSSILSVVKCCTLQSVSKASFTRERLRSCIVCVFKKVFRSHKFVSFNVSVQTRPLETLQYICRDCKWRCNFRQNTPKAAKKSSPSSPAVMLPWLPFCLSPETETETERNRICGYCIPTKKHVSVERTRSEREIFSTNTG